MLPCLKQYKFSYCRSRISAITWLHHLVSLRFVLDLLHHSNSYLLLSDRPRCRNIASRCCALPSRRHHHLQPWKIVVNLIWLCCRKFLAMATLDLSITSSRIGKAYSWLYSYLLSKDDHWTLSRRRDDRPSFPMGCLIGSIPCDHVWRSSEFLLTIRLHWRLEPWWRKL